MDSMKTWHGATGRDKASKEHLRLNDEIVRQFCESRRTGLGVVSVCVTNHLPDHYLAQVQVMLSPKVGLIVSSQEDWLKGHDFTLCNDHFAFAIKVAESVESYLSVGIPVLEREIRDIQAEILDILPAWREEGADVHLIDVHLRSRDDWDKGDCLTFEVTLSCLDGLLRPDTRTFEVEASRDIGASLAEFRIEMRQLFAMRAELLQHGADCFIDLLAYNVIVSHGDAGDVLIPLLTSGTYPHLPGATIFEEDGRIRVRGSDDRENFQWDSDTATLSSVTLPELMLVNAIGKPITALIEHQLLSPEMRIVEALLKPKFNPNVDDDGCLQLTIKFEQPVLLFSVATGEVTRRSDGRRKCL